MPPKPPPRNSGLLPQPPEDDVLLNITHPFAYGIDRGLSDVSTVLPGSLEHKPRVAAPKNPISRGLGEMTRIGTDVVVGAGALYGGRALLKRQNAKVAKEAVKNERARVKLQAKKKAPAKKAVTIKDLGRPTGETYRGKNGDLYDGYENGCINRKNGKMHLWDDTGPLHLTLVAKGGQKPSISGSGTTATPAAKPKTQLKVIKGGKN